EAGEQACRRDETEARSEAVEEEFHEREMGRVMNEDWADRRKIRRGMRLNVCGRGLSISIATSRCFGAFQTPGSRRVRPAWDSLQPCRVAPGGLPRRPCLCRLFPRRCRWEFLPHPASAPGPPRDS